MSTQPSSSSAQQRWQTFGWAAALRALARWNDARPADARRYNLLFAAIVMPPILVMLTLALTQEPLRGDLTRPGGYPEADYGWNQPQERFSPPLASTLYDRPFDVVVLGDSFSSNPQGQTDAGAYWTNFFARRTGLSIVVLSSFHTTLPNLLRHPIFVQAPPRVFILETVERYLIRDFAIEVDRRLGRFDDPAAPRPASFRFCLRFAPSTSSRSHGRGIRNRRSISIRPPISYGRFWRGTYSGSTPHESSAFL